MVDALSFDRARDLREVLGVAEELGARLTRLQAGDLVEAVAAVARDSGGTHLFVPQAAAGWREALRRPVAERLAQRLPDIDIHLVSGD
jgi:K+-sensing histidine kinase KdpD